MSSSQDKSDWPRYAADAGGRSASGSTAAGDGGGSSASGRDLSSSMRAKMIVADVLQRRARGQAVPDVEVLSAHPELYEDLKRELAIAAQIRRAMLETARRAGRPEVQAVAPPRLRLLNDSEIDKPIARVTYELEEVEPGVIEQMVRAAVS